MVRRPLDGEVPPGTASMCSSFVCLHEVTAIHGKMAPLHLTFDTPLATTGAPVALMIPSFYSTFAPTPDCGGPLPILTTIHVILTTPWCIISAFIRSTVAAMLHCGWSLLLTFRSQPLPPHAASHVSCFSPPAPRRLTVGARPAPRRPTVVPHQLRLRNVITTGAPMVHHWCLRFTLQAPPTPH